MRSTLAPVVWDPVESPVKLRHGSDYAIDHVAGDLNVVKVFTATPSDHGVSWAVESRVLGLFAFSALKLTGLKSGPPKLDHWRCRDGLLFSCSSSRPNSSLVEGSSGLEMIFVRVQ
jgi:hypothetical protein